MLEIVEEVQTEKNDVNTGDEREDRRKRNRMRDKN